VKRLCSTRLILALIAPLIVYRAIAQRDSEAAKSPAQLTGPEILRCAVSPQCEYDPFELADALQKKSNVKQLIAMYPHEADQAQQIIVIALARKKSAAVIALMRQAAFTGVKPGMTDEGNHYFALQYLADRCDADALRELNRPANFGDSYPVGCMWWQDTLKDFGKCNYRPATAHLARSLDSACLNNTQAAEESLRRLLPKSKCWKKAWMNGDFRAESDCYLNEAKSSVGQ
jgi:hypothetical protein